MRYCFTTDLSVDNMADRMTLNWAIGRDEPSLENTWGFFPKFNNLTS